MTERADIDRLADTVRKRELARGTVIVGSSQDWPGYYMITTEELDELAALACEPEERHLKTCQVFNANPPWRCTCGRYDLIERAEAAGARVAELERENDALRAEYENGENYILRSTHDAIVGRTARRVAELEAALRWYAEPRNYRYAAGDDRNAEHNENYCRVMQDDRWLGGQPGSRARAVLAGDGDGA